MVAAPAERLGRLPAVPDGQAAVIRPRTQVVLLVGVEVDAPHSTTRVLTAARDHAIKPPVLRRRNYFISAPAPALAIWCYLKNGGNLFDNMKNVNFTMYGK